MSAPTTREKADDMSDVSVVGLGRMGRAMATRLQGQGFTVTVHNRTRQRADVFATEVAVDVAATAREAAGAAALVVVSVADDHALRGIAGGDDGLVAGLGSGTVVLETSTVAPATMLWLEREVARTGAGLLDAPVSGSVPSVERGALTFLIGGPAQALAQAEPVLSALGERVLHLGGVGTGAAMKLAVNTVVHGLNASIAEALVLAEQAGVARADAYEAFAGSAAGAPFVHYKRPAFLDPEGSPTAFSLALAAKDLELALALAEACSAALPQARSNLEDLRGAIAEGLGEKDMSWLAQRLREQARGSER
jgi:3-hydroxyisobutyrate dehydrogenase-like beta-hydroxyacid dehydrogenase